MSLFGCRFLIGREKEGVESEVARLINESLEMDKTSRKVCFLKQGWSFGPVNDSTWFDCPVFHVCFIYEERKSRRR